MHPDDEHLLVVGALKMPIRPRPGRARWYRQKSGDNKGRDNYLV
jgi:hypothetical protein